LGLTGGVHIDAIVERLAEMFVGMLEPRGVIEHMSNLSPEQLIGMGREVAERVLAEDVLAEGIVGWRQTYGTCNTDYTGSCGVEAFDIHDVERVTHRVITLAVQRRNELMNTNGTCSTTVTFCGVERPANYMADNTLGCEGFTAEETKRADELAKPFNDERLRVVTDTRGGNK
jgi:hypothetical protein